MGFRCTWIAARNGSGSSVLPQLGLARERQSQEAVEDPGLYGLALASGWYLAIGDGSDFLQHLQEEQAEALSRSGEALFFFTDDTPMVTRLASYQRGSLAWAITYDGSHGVGDVDLEGSPPPLVSDALTRLRSEQEAAGGATAGVDHLYDLTADVARALIGFRHDEILGVGEWAPVDVLVPEP